MSIFTDWLIATEAEAASVAMIDSTQERSYKDWPHLALQGIGLMEFEHLAAIVRGDGDNARAMVGELLHQATEEGPFVAAVDPAFIDGLAALADTSLSNVATSWQQSDYLREWPLPELTRTLGHIVAFARRSRQAEKAVLQLMTM
ncbi:MAG: hypothetical protein HOW73_22565 [Polyangiaceae bacterium]|nr:hypothetical protein [Polyangiaceae bacterium]